MQVIFGSGSPLPKKLKSSGLKLSKPIYNPGILEIIHAELVLTRKHGTNRFMSSCNASIEVDELSESPSRIIGAGAPSQHHPTFPFCFYFLPYV